MSRGYIETLLKLPWEKASRDNRNLDKASQILEADHYGLEKDRWKQDPFHTGQQDLCLSGYEEAAA